MSDDGIVTIHGNQYRTVARRVSDFREAYKAEDGWQILTEIIGIDDQRVLMKATVGKDQLAVATGFAEEIRGSTKINKTSAVENCETSAVGRALAAFGLIGAEYQYASADEVQSAIQQQASPMDEAIDYLCKNHKDKLIEWSPQIAKCAKLSEAKQVVGAFIKAHMPDWKEIHGDDITKEQIIEEAKTVIKHSIAERNAEEIL